MSQPAAVESTHGSIEVDDLGPTLMHEHSFVLAPDVHVNAPDGWDESVAMERAVNHLEELYGQGGHTIVDLTVLGVRCRARIAG